MKKALIAIFLLGIVVLVGGGIYLTAHLDTLIANYQPQIERSLSDSLQMEVKLGQLEVTLFPGINIVAKNPSFQSTGAARVSASIGKLTLRPALLPLLSKRLSLKKVTVEDPVVTYDSTGSKADRNLPKNTPVSTTAHSSSGFSLDEHTLEIINGTFIFSADRRYEIKGIDFGGAINFSAGQLHIKELELSALLEQHRLELRSNAVSYQQAASTLSFTGSKLSLPGLQAEHSGEFRLADNTLHLALSTARVKPEQLLPFVKTLRPALRLPADITGSLSASAEVNCSLQDFVCVGDGQIDAASVAIAVNGVARVESIDGNASIALRQNGKSVVTLNRISALLARKSNPVVISGPVNPVTLDADLKIHAPKLSIADVKSALPIAASWIDTYSTDGILAINSSLKLDGGKPDVATGQIAVTDFELEVPGPEKSPLRLHHISGPVEFSWSTAAGGTATASGVTFAVEDLTSTFKTNAQLTIPDISGHGDIEADKLQIAELMKLFPAASAALPASKLSGKLVPEFKFDLKDGALTALRGSLAASAVGGSIIRADSPAVELHNGQGVVQIKKSTTETSFSSERFLITPKGSSDPLEIKADASTAAGRPVAGTARLKASRLDLSLFNAFMPAAGGQLAGSASSDVRFDFGDGGLKGADGKVALTDLFYKTDASSPIAGVNCTIDLSTPRRGVARLNIEDLSGKLGSTPLNGGLQADITPREIIVDPLNLSVFSGTARGRFKSELTDQKRFTTALEGSSFLAEEIIPALLPGATIKLTGNVQTLKLGLRGSRADKQSSVDGAGDLVLLDGVLHDVNLARLMVQKLADIPLIGPRLVSDIPAEFDPYFENNDTPIKKLTTAIRFDQGAIILDKLAAASDVYGVSGSGVINPDGSLNFNAVMIFDQDLSKALVGKVKELQALLSANGYLKVPFAVRGFYPDIKVRPDVEYLLKSGATRVIEEKLGDLLGDLLGGGGR